MAERIFAALTSAVQQFNRHLFNTAIHPIKFQDLGHLCNTLMLIIISGD